MINQVGREATCEDLIATCYDLLEPDTPHRPRLPRPRQSVSGPVSGQGLTSKADSSQRRFGMTTNLLESTLDVIPAK